MTGPLLSIVVPTKDRYETLAVLVDKVMSWPEQRFELVIQDNSSDNGPFQSRLARYGEDSRLRYLFQPEPVSAIANCDAAVARAQGQFISFIGDDDGILMQAVAAALWMERQGLEALICNVASYTWPDMAHSVAVNRILNGRLIFGAYAASVSKPNAQRELERVFRHGARHMFDMPRLYHSLVSKDALDRLRAATGSCFPGPVPDMANAVALCSIVTRYAYVDMPLVISGQSRKSMSGKNSVRAHQGEIEKEPSLPADAARHWDARVPRYWSGPTIWAEAAIKGAEATGRSDVVATFNFAALYAACLAFNERRYWPRVWAAMRVHGRFAAFAMCPAVAAYFIGIMVLRAKILLSKFVYGIEGKECADMAAVIDYLEMRLKQEGWTEKAFGDSASATR